MADRSKLRVWILLAMATGLGCYVWFGPTAFRQARMMDQARERLPFVVDRISSAAAFLGVTAGVSTGGGIVVAGHVGCQRDLQRLKDLLEPSAVWGGINYVVRVE